MEQLTFEGRVAIVTGGGSGIGAASARALAERGAKVVVNDLGCDVPGRGSDPTRAAAVVEDIRARGGTAIADATDVAAGGTGRKLVDLALETYGRVDIVMANAMFERVARFHEFARADVSAHLDAGVLGPWELIAAAWPQFEAQDHGRIVITGSTSLLGVPKAVPYGMAKAAQISLNRTVARVAEVEGRDIRSNIILPYANSAMWAHPQYGIAEDPRRETVKRLLSAEGVASTVLALSHERCPSSGQIYLCSAGKVQRVFIAATPGVERAGLTPEYLIERWADVDDAEGWRELVGNSMDTATPFMARALEVLGGSG